MEDVNNIGSVAMWIYLFYTWNIISAYFRLTLGKTIIETMIETDFN